MPRTLPWLKALGNTKRESSSPATEIKWSSSPTVKYKTGTPTKKESSTSRRDLLKSSPSPTSSPIHRCPSEEYLREGLDRDDIYMMVEDEFYTVAQTFTQHLHYAEFIRRKKEAKLQNAATIADIARPTDGTTPMSEELKKKYAAEELHAKKKEGLDAMYGKQADDDDAGDDLEEENSWAGTHLQDLMLSPRRSRALVGTQGIRSATRAAAGFVQSSGVRGNKDEGGNRGRVEEAPMAVATQNETTDDDDDLDFGVRQAAPTVLQRNLGASTSTSASVRSSTVQAKPPLANTRRVQPIIAITRPTPDSIWSTGKNQPSENTKKEASESSNMLSSTTQTKRRLNFDDFDDFSELPELRKPSVQPQRRRSDLLNTQQKKLKKDTGSKKSRLNEVPTFLV
ncbi:hypothetical protein BJX70DRAFT_225479 [Aspergillus crustosus]